jgi:hypothetical protein
MRFLSNSLENLFVHDQAASPAAILFLVAPAGFHYSPPFMNKLRLARFVGIGWGGNGGFSVTGSIIAHI